MQEDDLKQKLNEYFSPDFIKESKDDIWRKINNKLIIKNNQMENDSSQNAQVLPVEKPVKKGFFINYKTAALFATSFVFLIILLSGLTWIYLNRPPQKTGDNTPQTANTIKGNLGSLQALYENTRNDVVWSEPAMTTFDWISSCKDNNIQKESVNGYKTQIEVTDVALFKKVGEKIADYFDNDVVWSVDGCNSTSATVKGSAGFINKIERKKVLYINEASFSNSPDGKSQGDFQKATYTLYFETPNVVTTTPPLKDSMKVLESKYLNGTYPTSYNVQYIVSPLTDQNNIYGNVCSPDKASEIGYYNIYYENAIDPQTSMPYQRAVSVMACKQLSQNPDTNLENVARTQYPQSYEPNKAEVIKRWGINGIRGNFDSQNGSYFEIYLINNAYYFISAESSQINKINEPLSYFIPSGVNYTPSTVTPTVTPIVTTTPPAEESFKDWNIYSDAQYFGLNISYPPSYKVGLSDYGYGCDGSKDYINDSICANSSSIVGKYILIQPSNINNIKGMGIQITVPNDKDTSAGCDKSNYDVTTVRLSILGEKMLTLLCTDKRNGYISTIPVKIDLRKSAPTLSYNSMTVQITARNMNDMDSMLKILDRITETNADVYKQWNSYKNDTFGIEFKLPIESYINNDNKQTLSVKEVNHPQTCNDYGYVVRRPGDCNNGKNLVDTLVNDNQLLFTLKSSDKKCQISLNNLVVEDYGTLKIAGNFYTVKGNYEKQNINNCSFLSFDIPNKSVNLTSTPPPLYNNVQNNSLLFASSQSPLMYINNINPLFLKDFQGQKGLSATARLFLESITYTDNSLYPYRTGCINAPVANSDTCSGYRNITSLDASPMCYSSMQECLQNQGNGMCVKSPAYAGDVCNGYRVLNGVSRSCQTLYQCQNNQ